LEDAHVAKVIPGRVVVDHEDGVSVFMVGMRCNRIWKVHKWWPVFVSMPKMLRELQTDADSGLLGTRTMVGGRVIMVVQYWLSEEHLERFAHSTDRTHRAFWKWFNRNVKSNGDVGLWHEHYRVRPGEFDTSYVNMPLYGLAKATANRPATRTEPDEHDHQT
jgi:hypothetical protein